MLSGTRSAEEAVERRGCALETRMYYTRLRRAEVMPESVKHARFSQLIALKYDCTLLSMVHHMLSVAAPFLFLVIHKIMVCLPLVVCWVPEDLH